MLRDSHSGSMVCTRYAASMLGVKYFTAYCPYPPQGMHCSAFRYPLWGTRNQRFRWLFIFITRTRFRHD